MTTPESLVDGAGAAPRSGRVYFRRLGIADFRNIEQIVFQPAARFNLIGGDNGQGKTSLIEALYVLATTRSFRTGRLLEVIRQGTERGRVSAAVSVRGSLREQRAELSQRHKAFSLDDKKPKRKLDYALSTPVIAFHPGDLGLVSGAASARRTLLDRVLVYLDPAGAEARLRFLEAARARQQVLVERGPRARDLEVFEELMARHGSRFAEGRRRVADEILTQLKVSFASMAAADVGLEASYRPGGSEDAPAFAQELERRRAQDLRRGAVSFGPHRDELELSLSGRPARSHASQGQQRVLTLSLKIAELHAVREVTGLDPVLLLDDVSSELDQQRTMAVFRFLEETQSQVFVTTTRPELFANVELGVDERADFSMRGGQLEPLKMGGQRRA